MKNINQLKLSKDIIVHLKKEARHLNQTIHWFKFAKKTKYGWKFLKNKEKQWEALEEIVNRLAKKYRRYTTGKIVDMICNIVNTA